MCYESVIKYAMKYKQRSPFLLLRRLTKYELDHIDSFLSLSSKTRQSTQTSLERLLTTKDMEELNDWLVDEIAKLDEFATLTAGFTIVGLWRCVELYRKRAITIMLGRNAATNVYRHKELEQKLLDLDIKEKMVRCARSVDELRCINNAIKHERCVTNELCNFRLWKGKLGDKLGELVSHYTRLRPLVERYIEDLTNRLNYQWKKRSTPL